MRLTFASGAETSAACASASEDSDEFIERAWTSGAEGALSPGSSNCELMTTGASADPDMAATNKQSLLTSGNKQLQNHEQRRCSRSACAFIRWCVPQASANSSQTRNAIALAFALLTFSFVLAKTSYTPQHTIFPARQLPE